MPKTDIDKTLYRGHSPCTSCPYRKDTKLRIWDKYEFEKLLQTECETFGQHGINMGSVYGCHKNDQTVCRGWLINQDNRNFPSIALRISLSKNNITRQYLDKLNSPSPMFSTVEEMCFTNYPELNNN